MVTFTNEKIMEINEELRRLRQIEQGAKEVVAQWRALKDRGVNFHADLTGSFRRLEVSLPDPPTHNVEGGKP